MPRDRLYGHTAMSKIKRTPLFEIHQQLGAKIVDFAGFSMPVSYGGIMEEHRAVREKVGMFDVSHMGEFILAGENVKDFINGVVTNDVSRLQPGAVQYTVMCRDDGTVVDDLLVSFMNESKIMLVVNAANIEKDFAHISSFDTAGVQLVNASDDYGLIAVQGPMSRVVMKACPPFAAAADRIEELPYYRNFSYTHEGADVLVSRTGYTGELGYEVFLPSRMTPEFWEAITRTGQDHGIVPVGLGARDTLRFEASYCLYGHELDDTTTPLEAGLGWVVKLQKECFSGLEALREEEKNGSARTLVGLELAGRSIARQGFAVIKGDRRVGNVTSGTFSPTLQKSLCMAYIERSAAASGEVFHLEIRDKLVPAKLTQLPFYKSRARS
jgi:aminomethyltransferase